MGKSTALFAALLSILMAFSSFGGVYAAWIYSDAPPTGQREGVSLDLQGFAYVPEDMTEGEAAVVQRLSDILGNRYKTDKIQNSADYLINETIQVYWGGNIYADPYVGSMDTNFAEQIAALFSDVISESHVSFILKNQDLNGDGYREVAMYSTADPLTCVEEYDGIVCVYVTVFAPILDEGHNIVGYQLVCESLRGYCYEVFYDYESRMPSFSTDTWMNDVGYAYSDGLTYSLPDDAKHSYESYHRYYYPEQWWSSRTFPYGSYLWQCLLGKIPYYG